MTTGKTDGLGPFEQLVLTAVVTLGDRAYGVPIHATVSELAGKDVNMGSIYVTLDRLRDKGYVSSRHADPTRERGGKPKCYYRIEAAGQRALEQSVETSQRVSEAFESWRLGKWKPRRAK
jgi:DNA-binding PadR family transcriptional regulator